jgi:hypothetical protein
LPAEVSALAAAAESCSRTATSSKVNWNAPSRGMAAERGLGGSPDTGRRGAVQASCLIGSVALVCNRMLCARCGIRLCRAHSLPGTAHTHSLQNVDQLDEDTALRHCIIIRNFQKPEDVRFAAWSSPQVRVIPEVSSNSLNSVRQKDGYVSCAVSARLRPGWSQVPQPHLVAAPRAQVKLRVRYAACCIARSVVL